MFIQHMYLTFQSKSEIKFINIYFTEEETQVPIAYKKMLKLISIKGNTN